MTDPKRPKLISTITESLEDARIEDAVEIVDSKIEDIKHSFSEIETAEATHETNSGLKEIHPTEIETIKANPNVGSLIEKDAKVDISRARRNSSEMKSEVYRKAHQVEQQAKSIAEALHIDSVDPWGNKMTMSPNPMMAQGKKSSKGQSR